MELPVPGAEIPPFTMTGIDLPRIEEFMDLMHDTNPVHDDEELIERLGLRGPVNQGPANLAYVMNMLLAWAGEAGRLERFDFRFLEVVVPGDEPTARGVVRAVDGDRVECDVRLELDGGSRALEGVARIVLDGGS